MVSTKPTASDVAKCHHGVWDGEIITNETLIGGINSGDFRDHGQVISMEECMGYCCDESDCDLSFMIDKDCYTVKCYKPSLCKTRSAKPTAFTPMIAFKKAAKLGELRTNNATPQYFKKFVQIYSAYSEDQGVCFKEKWRLNVRKFIKY